MKKWLFILFCIPVVWGQTHKEVYTKIADLYTKAKSFKVEIAVSVFYAEGFEMANQKYKGTIIKDNQSYYTNFADKLNLCTEGKNLFIDKTSRLIMISHSDYDEVKLKKELFAGFEDESYLKKYDFKLIKSDDTYTSFSITPVESSSVYKEIKLTLHTNNYSFHQVVYHMNISDNNTVEKVEIDYVSNQFNTDVKSDELLLKTYIQRKNDTYSGVGNYAGFKVINQIK